MKKILSTALLLSVVTMASFAQKFSSNHGIFCSNWQAKSANLPAKSTVLNQHFANPHYQISFNPTKVINKVSENIFGINATTYTGNYLGDSSLLKNVSVLKPSLIRFPGGDASNMYFFNGLPNDLPSKALTYNGDWTDFADGSAEVNWKMNTASYYAFRDSIAASGIITVNYPYARYGLAENPVAVAASLAADWVRFDNGRTKYWEVGNETYACWEGGFRIDTTKNKDGQPEYINGKLYGEHFRVFADSMRAAAQQLGAEIYIGAVFADDDHVWDGSGKNITKNWNDLLAPELRRIDGSCYADFISVHSYFLNKNEQSPLEIINSYKVVNELQNYIYTKLNKDSVKHVPMALTEWNIKEPHQTTQVGALQAVATICNMQESGFGASSYFSLKDYWRAQKGDFGMFSNQDPQVPESTPYAAFYHFYYLKNTLGDKIIQSTVEPFNDSILCYTSSFSDGSKGMVLINKSYSSKVLQINTANKKGNAYWYQLSPFDDNNTWTEKITVNGISNTLLTKGGPVNSYRDIPAHTIQYTDSLSININGLSAIYLLLQN